MFDNRPREPFVLQYKFSRGCDNTPVGSVLALIDSGSTLNIVLRQFVVAHSIPTFKGNGVNVQAANGAHEYSDTHCMVSLHLGDWHLTVVFTQLDFVQGDMYLGVPFVEKFAKNIDWKGRTFLGHAMSTPEDAGMGGAVLLLQHNPEKFPHYDKKQFDLWVEDGSIQTRQSSPGIPVKTLEECAEWIRAKLVDEFQTPREPGIHMVWQENPRPYVIRKLDPDWVGPQDKVWPKDEPDKKLMWEQVQEWERLGIVRRSSSPCHSNPFLVPKDNGSSHRLVVDFRNLNKGTLLPSNTLPTPEELYAMVRASNAMVLSRIDFTNGFLQIPLAEESKHLTAFVLYGIRYEFNVMPFGIHGAPAHFQEVVSEILGEFVAEGSVVIYIDDVLLMLPSVEEHKVLLERVLATLKKHRVVINEKKSEFFCSHLSFLGMIVGLQGVAPDPRKIDKIARWPEPTTVKEAQSFLGFANYLRRFYPDSSRLSRPINQFIAGKVTHWGSEQTEAFHAIRAALADPGALVNPSSSDPVLIECDACDVQTAAVLFLLEPGGKRKIGVIEFQSKVLSLAERNYPVQEKELLAAVRATKQWRAYLLNRLVFIHSDHLSLSQSIRASGRLARWLYELLEFNIRFVYVKGKDNVAADTLSRLVEPAEIQAPEVVELPLAAGSDPVFWDIDDPLPTVGRTKVVSSVSELSGRAKTVSIPTAPLVGEVGRRNPTRTLAALTSFASESYGYALALTTIGVDWPFEVAKVDEVVYIKEALDRDPEFSPIVRALRSPNIPPPTIRETVKRYHLDKEGLLWIRIHEEDDPRMCLPACHVRPEIILRVHKATGHLEWRETYRVMGNLYYYRKLRKNVERVVASCRACQVSKKSRQLPQGYLQPLPLPYSPWTDIQVDFFGSVPLVQGKDFVMIIVDRFSKRVLLEAVSTRYTARQVFDVLIRRVVVYFGIPQTITLDNDIRFRGFYKQIANALGVSLRFTTKNHPQTNGLAERMVGAAKQILRTVTDNQPRDWLEVLPYVELWMNRAAKRSLDGLSPYEADRGYMPAGLEFVKRNIDLPQSIVELRERIDYVRRIVIDSLLRSVEANEAQANKHLRDADYAVGDWVLVLRKVYGNGATQQNLSLQPVYHGPFQIVGEMGPNAFELDYVTGTKEMRKVNVSYLKHYIPPEYYGGHLRIPATDTDIHVRIKDVASVRAFDEEEGQFWVTWGNSDPECSTPISFAQFKMLLKQRRIELLEAVVPWIPDPDTVPKLFSAAGVTRPPPPKPFPPLSDEQFVRDIEGIDVSEIPAPTWPLSEQAAEGSLPQEEDPLPATSTKLPQEPGRAGFAVPLAGGGVEPLVPADASLENPSFELVHPALPHVPDDPRPTVASPSTLTRPSASSELAQAPLKEPRPVSPTHNPKPKPRRGRKKMIKATKPAADPVPPTASPPPPTTLKSPGKSTKGPRTQTYPKTPAVPLHEPPEVTDLEPATAQDGGAEQAPAPSPPAQETTLPTERGEKPPALFARPHLKRGVDPDWDLTGFTEGTAPVSASAYTQSEKSREGLLPKPGLIPRKRLRGLYQAIKAIELFAKVLAISVKRLDGGG